MTVSHKSVLQDRGIATIPAAVHRAGDIEAQPCLSWAQVTPHLWLVCTSEEQVEAAVPIVAQALAVECSPFPRLMRRLLANEITQRAGRGATSSTSLSRNSPNSR